MTVVKKDDEVNDFVYRVNSLPGRIKKEGIFTQIRSPRNSSSVRMYILFVIGSFVLGLLTYITVRDVNFYGSNTYLQYFERYSQIGQPALYSIITMIVINLFWILINVLIEFLAKAQEWIPPKVDWSKAEPAAGYTKLGARAGDLINRQEIAEFLGFDEQTEVAREKQIREQEMREDAAEHDAILNNPSLSPLAYLWTGVKKIYRLFQRLPRRITYYWRRGAVDFELAWRRFQYFLINGIDFVLYFLNPLNLVDEVVDVSVSVLVRLLYPALLTPIIFFFPMRISFVFENFWQVLIYFILIGGLRVGVEFFSIYIRFLRNTRYNNLM